MEPDKTSEARRKAQRNGEEDPVVVAQRFLNIYRQLHIFNAERKASFNKMLLELSPQIRGLFGQLPGGALLQDYVDELAEKEGVAKSVQQQTDDSVDEGVKQAKILATALAEAQVQATAKMQEMAAVSPLAAPAPAAMTAPATTAKLSMDKTFAQEFATVLAAAMQKNAATQETEIKNIINTLGQTQLEIIKVLQTENSEHREEMKNISQMMLQAQTQISAAPPQATSQISDETKQLIKILVTGQRQMIERVAKVEALAREFPQQETEEKDSTENKTLSLILEQSEQNFSKMAAALTERQKNDTLEIARLINESQQNLVQMLVQHNTLNQNSGNAAATNNNANNIQINSADYSAVLEKIAARLDNLQPGAAPANIQVNFPEQAVSQIVKAQSELYREIAAEQTKELSAVIALALKESQKASARDIIDALGSRPLYIQTPADTTAAAAEAFAHQPPSIPPFEAADMAEPLFNPAPQTEPIDLFDDEVGESAPAEDEAPHSDFVFSEGPAEPAEESVAAEPQPDEEAFAETTGTEPLPVDESEDETPKKKKRKRRKKKKKSAVEDLLPMAEDTVLAAEADTAPAAAENFEDTPVWQPEETAAAPEEESALTPAADDYQFDETESAAEAETYHEPAAAPIENLAESADDWGFTPAPEPEPKAEQDWEWAYEEETPAETDDNSGEGSEWEWEYVPETEESISFQNDNLQPLAETSPIACGDLFFQKQIYNPQPPLTAGSPVYAHGARIFDSAAQNSESDPYQNSARKD